MQSLLIKLVIAFSFICSLSWADNAIELNYDQINPNTPLSANYNLTTNSSAFPWTAYSTNARGFTTLSSSKKVFGVMANIPKGAIDIMIKTDERTIHLGSFWPINTDRRLPFVVINKNTHKIIVGYYKNSSGVSYVRMFPLTRDDGDDIKIMVKFEKYPGEPQNNNIYDGATIQTVEGDFASADLDLGLRVREGTTDKAVAFQNPDTTQPADLSPLRLSKTYTTPANQSYSIGYVALVDPTDRLALKTHINTRDGVKALKTLEQTSCQNTCPDRCAGTKQQTGTLQADCSCQYTDAIDCGAAGCADGLCCSNPKETVTNLPVIQNQTLAQCGNMTCDLSRFDRCKTVSFTPNTCNSQYSCVEREVTSTICDTIKLPNCNASSIAIGTTLWAGCNLGASDSTSFGTYFPWQKFDYTTNIDNVCPTGWHVPTPVEWSASIGKITLPQAGAGMTHSTRGYSHSPLEFTTLNKQGWYWVNRLGNWVGSEAHDFHIFLDENICNTETGGCNPVFLWGGDEGDVGSFRLDSYYSAPIRCVYDKPIKEGECLQNKCDGAIPDHATMCTNDNINLNKNFPITIVNKCTDATKCEYTCNIPYSRSGQSAIISDIPEFHPNDSIHFKCDAKTAARVCDRNGYDTVASILGCQSYSDTNNKKVMGWNNSSWSETPADQYNSWFTSVNCVKATGDSCTCISQMKFSTAPDQPLDNNHGFSCNDLTANKICVSNGFSRAISHDGCPEWTSPEDNYTHEWNGTSWVVRRGDKGNNHYMPAVTCVQDGCITSCTGVGDIHHAQACPAALDDIRSYTDAKAVTSCSGAKCEIKCDEPYSPIDGDCHLLKYRIGTFVNKTNTTNAFIAWSNFAYEGASAGRPLNEATNQLEIIPSEKLPLEYRLGLYIQGHNTIPTSTTWNNWQSSGAISINKYNLVAIRLINPPTNTHIKYRLGFYHTNGNKPPSTTWANWAYDGTPAKAPEDGLNGFNESSQANQIEIVIERN